MSEEDKKREDTELVRLLYVGMTRIRDHLVLSTHTQGWKMDGVNDRWIGDTEAIRRKPLALSGGYLLLR